MACLFPFVAFDPVETPLSLAARLAGLHTAGRVAPFLRDLGIKPSALAAGEQQSIERLCAAAGIEPGPVLANAAIRIGKRSYSVRGEVVSAEMLSNPATVFCPACLAEDDQGLGRSGTQRRGRFEWILRPVRTCSIHHLPLVFRRISRGDDELHELEHCVPERGDDLSFLAESSSPRPVSPLQDYVVGRLQGAGGPDWLDAQSLEQAVRSTEMLGVLLTFGPAPNLNTLTEDEWDLAGRMGYGVTSEGERAIRDALSDVDKTFRQTGRRPGPRKLYGRLYEWLAHSDADKDPGDIKRVLGEHLMDTMEMPGGAFVLGRQLDVRRLHSVASLASESGVDSRTLRKLLVARGLIPSEAAASNYLVFDAEAGRAVASSMQRLVHVIALPKVMNCSRPVAGQLLDELILTPLAEGPSDATGRTQKAVDAQQVQDFMADLSACATKVEDMPDGIVPLAKAAEKAGRPVVDIIHLVLARFVRTVIQTPDQVGLASFHVDPAEIRHLMDTVMIGVSARDAFGILHIPSRTGWALSNPNADRPILPSIRIASPNGRHEIRRFRQEDIARFAAEFTSLVHIANELGVSSKEVMLRLKVSRTRPALTRFDVGIDFYRRSDLPLSCIPCELPFDLAA